MKNKLEKFNRKRSYYRFRRALIIVTASLFVLAAIAVPVGISVYKDVHVSETIR